MLRLAARASSSVVPGAIRIFSNAFTQKLNISNTFCTGANNSSTDGELVKALKSEIKSVKSFPAPVAPADFPFTIEIEEENPDGTTKEKKTAGLRRELHGEKVYISVALPGIVYTSEAGILYLYVRIDKPNGNFVDFAVQMCPHVIHVATMTYMEPAPCCPGKYHCLGVHDVEDEGELQSALQEYLKIRGVLPSYAEFIHKYMVSSIKDEHLHDLKKMKKFVKD